MYLKSCDSQRARAPGERAHNVKKCTNEFVDPKNSMMDTKNIEIGSLEVLKTNKPKIRIFQGKKCSNRQKVGFRKTYFPFF